MGYTRLILTGVYLADRSARRDMADALPDATFCTVLLQADDSTRVSRLRPREIGTGFDDHVASTRRASKALAGLLGEHIHVVETDGRTVDEVAAEVATITGCRQVIGLELRREQLDDDWWEMLDIVQAHLAQQLDGLLLVPAEGLFDEDLRCIASFDGPVS